MGANLLLEILRKLFKIHLELLELGKKKTEAIKHNDLHSLEEVIKSEQKQIALLRQTDEERVKIVLAIFKGKQLPSDSPTITDCIEVITDQKMIDEITIVQNNLLTITTELKKVNDLNQLLIKQSLQLVNVTLDTLSPQRNITNYESKGNIAKDKNASKSSMFDSKV